MFNRSKLKSRLFRALFPIMLGMVCYVSNGQSGSGTRLHQIEQLSGSSERAASYDALAKFVLGNAYSADLSALTGLQAELSSAQKEFVAEPKKHGSSDFDVIAAFDEWRGVLRDPNAQPTSPYMLYRFRASLSHFAPSLITKDENGIVSDRLSPVEAVYLFDFLIANGGVPQVSTVSAPGHPSEQQDAGSKQSGQGYASGLTTYLSTTPPSKRQSTLADIVHAHLLKLTPSTK
jgi:hypothetical protein